MLQQHFQSLGRSFLRSPGSPDVRICSKLMRLPLKACFSTSSFVALPAV